MVEPSRLPERRSKWGCAGELDGAREGPGRGPFDPRAFADSRYSIN